MMNAIKFLRAAAKRYTSGENVSKDVYSERLETCVECPHRDNRKCGKCGCILAIKAKWSTEKCPDNRW